MAAPHSLRRIPWHPAFVQALRLELESCRHFLEFQSEVQLTAEPLQIDLVVIRKIPGPVIEKNIARIFRQVNLLEYKSPGDYISVHDLYKTLGYSYLYAALHHLDIREMSLSIIGSRYPRDLFRYLREGERRSVTEREAGIYEVEGYPLAIQVVESKRLDMGENLWIRGLGTGLNAKLVGAILEKSEENEENLGAYLYAVLGANVKSLKEAVEMARKKEPTLEEALEEMGFAAKWVQQGIVKGEARGERTAWGRMLTLLKEGYTVEQLERMGPGDSPSP